MAERKYLLLSSTRIRGGRVCRGVKRAAAGVDGLLRMHVFAFNTFFDDVDRAVSPSSPRVRAYVYVKRTTYRVPLKYSPCQSWPAKCGWQFPRCQIQSAEK